MKMKCPVIEGLIRIGICVGIAASLATVVPGLPRALLRQELETSIRKWIVRDRQGNYLLLSPQHGSGNRDGFSLRKSQGSSPESLDDFGTSYPLEPPLKERGVLISAGISLDHQDRIHLGLEHRDRTHRSTPSWIFPAPAALTCSGTNPQTKSLGALASWPTNTPGSGTLRRQRTEASGSPGPSR